MKRVIDDDADALRHVGRSFRWKAVVRPTPVAQANNVTRQPKVVDDGVRAENDRERRQGLRNKDERQQVTESMRDRNAKFFMFVSRHPVRLQYIVADEMADQLFHGPCLFPMLIAERSVRFD